MNRPQMIFLTQTDQTNTAQKRGKVKIFPPEQFPLPSLFKTAQVVNFILLPITTEFLHLVE